MRERTQATAEYRVQQLGEEAKSKGRKWGTTGFQVASLCAWRLGPAFRGTAPYVDNDASSLDANASGMLNGILAVLGLQECF